MNHKHYIGKRLSNFELLDEVGPVTGVALLLDDENEIFVGDDTGYVLEIECPYGTDAMARNILSEVSGRVYKAYQGSNAVLSPAAELGDGVTVNGVYSMLADRDIVFGPGHMSDVSAPGESTLQHEYPYIGTYEKKLNRKIAQTRSLITKTAEEIRLEVFKEIDGVEAAFSELELTVDGIAGRVGDVEGNIAELELTAQGFAVDISDLQGNYTEVAVTLDGLTVSGPNGETYIKDDAIQTGSITADKIDSTDLHVKAANIDGTLTADQIVLTGSISWGDLNQSVQNTINSAGGISAADATTLITNNLVSSPTIRGASIYGGIFSDLGGQNYITMYTEDDEYGSNSFLNHYSSIYSTSLPLMSMGYRNLGYGTDQWLMQVRNRTVMLMGEDDVLNLWGVWNFSGATVTGLSVVFG